MGELEGAHPSKAGPAPVLLRAHTRLCPLQEEEDGGRGGGKDRLGWAGLGSRSASGPVLQIGVDSAAPSPLTAAPVCSFLCIHLHTCLLSAPLFSTFVFLGPVHFTLGVVFWGADGFLSPGPCPRVTPSLDGGSGGTCRALGLGGLIEGCPWGQRRWGSRGIRAALRSFCFQM